MAVLPNVSSGDPHVAAHNAERTEINAHAARVDNPHATTKAQVGLGSVDNTTDAAKPVSTAQAAATTAAITAHSVSTADPHAQYSGPRGLIAATADLNTYINPGVYRVTSPNGILSANMPVAKVGFLEVISYSFGATSCSQTYWEDSGESYTRGSVSGVWKAWVRLDNLVQDSKQMYGTGSPLGVVSAAVGTKYTDTARTAGALEWFKSSGSSGNLGWICTSGDTGYINSSPLVKLDDILWSNTPTAITTRLSRSGNIASMYLQISVGSTPTSPQTLCTIPPGFCPPITQYAVFKWNGATNYQNIISPTGPLTIYSLTAGLTLRGTASWYTDDPWPTSLTMPVPP